MRFDCIVKNIKKNKISYKNYRFKKIEIYI